MAAKNKKIPDDVRENMFNFWSNNDRHAAKTAAEFGVARQTIATFIKKYKWQDRYKEIQLQVEKKTDITTAKAIAANIDYVRAIKRKLLKTLLGKTNLEGTISELIKLMEYEDKLLGISPDEKQEPSTLIFNIIQTMSADEQSQLDKNLEIFYGNGTPMDPEKRIPEIIAESETEPGVVSSSDGERSKT